MTKETLTEQFAKDKKLFNKIMENEESPKSMALQFVDMVKNEGIKVDDHEGKELYFDISFAQNPKLKPLLKKLIAKKEEIEPGHNSRNYVLTLKDGSTITYTTFIGYPSSFTVATNN